MIRVFVGCDPNHCDLESQAVLEWSIRKHASQPVEITWMRLSHDPASPWSGWNTKEWTTTFSGFRWAIPEVCGFKGRAIYTDSDVIFMADIAELWRQEFRPGKAVMAKGGGSWRLCVSMWDCEAARQWVLPLGELKANPHSHAIMTQRVRSGKWVQAFDGNWNCLDGENYNPLSNPEVKAIHYTSIGSQPHLRYAIARLKAKGLSHWYDGRIERHWRPDLVTLFDELFEEAKANGYPPERYADVPRFGDFQKRSLKNYRSGVRAA
jgi:hypothetical protein